MDDYALSQEFSYLPSKCVVLLENVDSISITRKTGQTKTSHDKEKRGVSRVVILSSLLSALDGNVSSENSLLIMTSDTLNTLNPVQVRLG
jgi:ATP-dependent 26S proteasome regulatory subunit